MQKKLFNKKSNKLKENISKNPKQLKELLRKKFSKLQKNKLMLKDRFLKKFKNWLIDQFIEKI